MRDKVLWVEDGAFVEVATFSGAVLTGMKYDLEAAIDVSDAVKKIRATEYAAVIVDIRIPPGSDREWRKLYNQAGKYKDSARLGMQFLFSLLKPDRAKVKLDEIPGWISPQRFGVFTVEGKREEKLNEDLEYLGIEAYLQKQTNLSHSALLDFIEKIVGSSKADSKQGGKE